MANISTDFSTWSATPASNQPDSADTASIQADLQALQAALKIIFPNIGAALTPTHTELNCIDGVTSSIQTQLNAKAASGTNSDITSLTACTQITATSVTVATDDKVLVKDTSAGDALKTVTAESIANLKTGNLPFPAVQVASADPNTLDDYEEGSWTPTLTSVGGTGISVNGTYTKIGRLVHYQISITGTALTTTAGSSRTSLPVSTSQGGGNAIWTDNNLTQGFVGFNTNTHIYCTGSMTSTTAIYISGSYHVL